MSFLKKMFGKTDPVEEMRQSHARQDWARVLDVAKRIDEESLDPAIRDELLALEDEAGDALAMVNLEEGAWAQKSGNLLRAREDYQLAIEQARSEDMRARAEQALAALERGELPLHAAEEEHGPALHTGCNSCAPAAGPAAETDDSDLDEESRLELLLATLPAALAERYKAATPAFRRAWLAAQGGDPQQASAFLEAIPEDERDALFLYERGSLKARREQHEAAVEDLKAALTIEPDLSPAFEALTDVLAKTGQADALQKTLKQAIADDTFVGYCWSRLAELHAQRGELEPALAAGLKALDEQVVDPALFALCAQLLERVERYKEAEALLLRLPTGGCGGGAHPLLAEFWLRRGTNLDRALESFKGAMRQERDNPRWLLRIAQVYLAKGWRKEAADQVERLMHQGNLPDSLREEVRTVADQLQKS